jgi:hypothetical protein
MPLPRFRAAVANGNWSNPATWNNGEIPGPNDVVALNDYTVDIDQDINVYELSNFDRSYTSYNSFKLMTYDVFPEGVTSASFNNYLSYYPFSVAGFSLDVNVSIANPLWYAYEYPAQQPIVIDRYTFNVLGGHPYDPRDWKFQGWNATTSTWVDLDTVAAQTSFPNSIYISNVLSHTTAYYKYRIIVTQGRNGDGTCRLWNIRFYEKNTYYTTTIPRGTTNVTTSRILTVGAGGLTCASFNSLMTMSSGAGTTVNFNGNFRGPYTNSTSIFCINITGLGTYNFTGNILKVLDYNSGSTAINVNSACTVNVYGNVFGPGGNNLGHINMSANGSTVNVFGNLEGAAGLYETGVVRITGASNLNVYGNVIGTPDPNIPYGHTGIFCSNSGANIVVVGNVAGSPSSGPYGSQGTRSGMTIYAANSVHITGNVTAGSFWLGTDTRFYGIYVGSVPTLTIVGTLQASLRTHALITAASIYTREIYGYNYQLSGPFVSGPSGEMPYQMAFFKLISNISNYYQFRDLNLNTTSMLSPNTILDLPLPNNVRLGTSYGSGNYIGTLAVPAANRVSSGIAVDNTVGTAILTPGDVWNIQTSALTAAGSVGIRLKNIATVEMVGAQLEAFLKRD